MSGKYSIQNVKLDIDEFIRYVRVVSNEEIELIHGGDTSELSKHLQMLWNALADEVKLVEK